VDALLALLAAVLFGALSVAVRLGQRGIADTEVGAGATVAVATPFVLVLAAAAAPEAPEPAALWPFFLVGLAVPGVSTFLFQRAVQESGASRPTIVLGIAPLVSILLAAAFLDEGLGPVTVAGTLLVVLGTAVLAREQGRPAHFRALGLVLAGVCALLFACRDNVVRAVARDVDAPTLHLVGVSLLGAALSVYGYLLLVRGPERIARVRRALPAMAPAGLLLGGAYAAVVAAFDEGPVTTVAPLVATQALWGVLASWLLLARSERIGLRLLAAAALVVAGGALIGVSR
jgi:drug/metabolite transporter (DMT)-like permease